MLVVFLSLLSIFCNPVSLEPKCSRYHYEEKLLEKVIRMEIRMEEIEAKLKTYENEGEKRDKILDQVLTKSEVSVQTKTVVAFSASAVNNQYGATKDQALIFESVLSNIGKAYSPNSGQFVAPVSGTYFFHCSVISGNGAEIWLYIAVNNSIKARFYARGTDRRHDMGSQALVIALKTADVISVHNHDEGGNIYGQTYPTFSGFLLH